MENSKLEETETMQEEENLKRKFREIRYCTTRQEQNSLKNEISGKIKLLEVINMLSEGKKSVEALKTNTEDISQKEEQKIYKGVKMRVGFPNNYTALENVLKKIFCDK